MHRQRRPSLNALTCCVAHQSATSLLIILKSTPTLRRFTSGEHNRSPAREFEVLRLLGARPELREIAESMGISPKTVPNNQSPIKQKPEIAPIELLRNASELGMG
jgi:DNA-binding NarL/FixJ family response regulator